MLYAEGASPAASRITSRSPCGTAEPSKLRGLQRSRIKGTICGLVVRLVIFVISSLIGNYRRSSEKLPAPNAATCNRSEEHTSELQSLMRISYAVFCLKKNKHNQEKQQKKHKHNLAQKKTY